MKEKLLPYLESFLTKRRSDLIDQVLENRTRYITVALEDIYQSQNASAVLRTCDCTGIQDVHIIENRNRYHINPEVALGSDKWLNLARYSKHDDNTTEAINNLRNSGYRIIATTPHILGQNLDDFDIHKGKAAFFLGTELNGLSDRVLKNADEFLQIPMFGFTRSYNISVSAAIILYHITKRLRDSEIKWQLSDSERKALKIRLIKNNLKLGESSICTME
ncbi:MAG: RNA methyltransferase [Bacteroidales bacterium]|nr:RNA methyltransferase [Bacteroidales bacterium]